MSYAHNGNATLAAFAEAIAVEVRRNKPRPFAAFRGDHRRPVKLRHDGTRRLYAMAIVPDRASNIAKLQRGLRIIRAAKAEALRDLRAGA